MTLHKLSAFLYLILLAVLSAVIVYKLPHTQFEGSVLSLLPDENRSALDKNISDEFLRRIDSQAVFLIKDSNDGKSAESFYNKIKTIDLVLSVTGRIDDSYKAQFNNFLYENKLALIDDDLRDRLNKGKYENKVLSKVYSALSGTGHAELTSDPLLLTRQIASSLSKGSPFTVKNGFLSCSYKNETWYFINLKLKSSGFDIRTGHQFVTDVNRIVSEVENEYKDTVILKRGTCFYSDYASSKASADITVLGSLTVILVFAFIYYVFRSLSPLLLSLLSVGAALTGGLALTLIFYQKISLILLGMCLCVIGIVCDYTIYYLSRRMTELKKSPIDTLKTLLKPLLFACITDLCAYLIILLTPVDSLRQIALFSAGALTMACLFVITIEPYIAFSLKEPKHLNFTNIERFLSFITKKNVRYLLLAFFISVSFAGLFFYKTGDDPKTLQDLPYDLKNEDSKISEITKQNNSMSFIVVQDDDLQNLLKTYDSIKTCLNEAKKDNVISSFKALPYNSVETQRHDFLLIKKNFEALKNLYERKNIGLNISEYSYRETGFDEFLNSNLGISYQDFVVKTDDNYAVLILLDEIKNRKLLELKLLSFDNVFLSERHREITDTFRTFRHYLCLVLLSFIVVIILSSVLRLGIKKGLTGALMNLIAVLFSGSVLLLSGYSINIFNILSLILVLGIGVNYSVFFTNSDKENRSLALLSIFTAFITTLLSLGILIFSSTAAVKGFGITLTSGLFASFILSIFIPYFFNKNECKSEL